VLVVALLARFTIGAVWDDAYIVLRYADRLIATGVLSWNPGEPPTYGLTSPLFLGVVVPIRAGVDTSPALAALLSSLVCGVIAIGLMLRLIAGASPGWSLAALLRIALLIISLALSAGPLADHLSSGMDTTFAMAWLSVYFLLVARRGPPAATLAGVWGGLAFLARPDLLLFTLSTPVVLALTSSTREGQAGAFRMLRSTLITLGIQLALTTWYFGSTLPLPFHAKGGNLYGDSIRETYAGVAWAQLRAFVRSFWPLFLMAGVGILIDPRRWWRRDEPLEKGILAGVLLFLGYHAFFVLPIMYYSQRFYYPALPALAYLAGRGVTRLIESGPPIAAWGAPARMVAALAALLAIAGVAHSGLSEWRALGSVRAAGRFGGFSVTRHFTEGGMDRVWPGLDVIAALPDDLRIATTEVGFPAAMNPGKRIIDLAGLDHADIALGRTSPSDVVRRERPDVLYLPHPDYREMNRRIRNEPDLLAAYEMAPEASSPPTLDLAILRSSPHYEALRPLVRTPVSAAGIRPGR
jgi:hypothetical protein